MIISLGNTFQQYWANMNKTRWWIDSLDFIVHIGMYYEDTVKYADMVLPVCSKFEDTVEHSIVRSDYNHVNLQTKCIDPLFESKPDFDVMRLIAEEMGVGEYLPKTADELVRYQIEHSEDLADQGITLAELKKNHGSMKMADVDEPRRAYTDLKFETPTTRMEPYYEAWKPCEQAWPNWEENNEAYVGNPLAEKYPLQFTQTRTRFSNHSHFKAAKWVQQFAKPTLELNPPTWPRAASPTGTWWRRSTIAARSSACAREQRRAPRLLPHLGSGLEQVHRGGEHAKRHERPREPAR